MKIVYILHDSSEYSGAFKSFRNLLSEVVNQRIEPLIITPDITGIHNILTNNGYDVVSFKFRYNIIPPLFNFKDIIRFIPRCLIWPRDNWIAVENLLPIIKKFNPDIIHSNSSVVGIGLTLSKILGIPHIMHLREYGDKDHRMHILKLNNNLNTSLSYSIAITKDIQRYRHLLNNPNSRVIYNGIVSECQIRKTNKKLQYFLYAGRIEPTKGVKDLIDAYILYAKDNKQAIKLKIAGSAKNAISFFEELKHNISSNNLDDNVEWLGERDDVADLMYESYATIIPSYFEGFGRVMPEAMANGSLVIVRDTGGSKEQLTNGFEITGNDIALHFLTVEELAQRMHEVTTNGIGHYWEMIKQSQIVVKSLYTTEINGRQTIAFYKDILKHNKR